MFSLSALNAQIAQDTPMFMMEDARVYALQDLSQLEKIPASSVVKITILMDLPARNSVLKVKFSMKLLMSVNALKE